MGGGAGKPGAQVSLPLRARSSTSQLPRLAAETHRPGSANESNISTTAAQPIAASRCSYAPTGIAYTRPCRSELAREAVDSGESPHKSGMDSPLLILGEGRGSWLADDGAGQTNRILRIYCRCAPDRRQVNSHAWRQKHIARDQPMNPTFLRLLRSRSRPRAARTLLQESRTPGPVDRTHAPRGHAARDALRRKQDAERQQCRYHAERGNDQFLRLLRSRSRPRAARTLLQKSRTPGPVGVSLLAKLLILAESRMSSACTHRF
jgi:hypothetical protein